MSSIELIISVTARRNIQNILEYTEAKWGVDQRDAYDVTLNNAFRRIQAFPDIGRVADESRSDLREYQLQHHAILYRREPEAVTILRVINPRRLRRSTRC